MDGYQHKAVTTNERNALIVAAPGSGKTTVIINRVNYLVNSLNIENKNIIVITFTKAAAVNMKKRYEEVFKTEVSPFFGTFHGLFYKILLRSGKNIDIIDGGIVHKIVSSVLNKYFDEVNDDKVKETINNISVFKTSRKTLSEFRASVSQEIFEEAYTAYEQYKEENNKWDFDDLAVRALELLSNDRKLLEGYKRLFRYVLVDEFQDCDEIQVEFLKLINDESENSLFAVGDEDQCIYSFRGSKPEYMVSFDKMFENGKKYYLSINYRSRKNIVEKSKEVIKYNKERNSKEIKWNKENDGIIRWCNSYNEKEQGEAVVDIIENNKKMNTPYEDNAVLYRTNIESMGVIDVLTKRKIPFTLIDREYNFFEHFICKDLISYLKLSVNEFDRSSFVQIINKHFQVCKQSKYRICEDIFKRRRSI